MAFTVTYNSTFFLGIFLLCLFSIFGYINTCKRLNPWDYNPKSVYKIYKRHVKCSMCCVIVGFIYGAVECILFFTRLFSEKSIIFPLWKYTFPPA